MLIFIVNIYIIFALFCAVPRNGRCQPALYMVLMIGWVTKGHKKLARIWMFHAILLESLRSPFILVYFFFFVVWYLQVYYWFENLALILKLKYDINNKITESLLLWFQGGHFVFIDNPSGFHSAVLYACRRIISSDPDNYPFPEGLTSAWRKWDSVVLLESCGNNGH